MVSSGGRLPALVAPEGARHGARGFVVKVGVGAAGRGAGLGLAARHALASNMQLILTTHSTHFFNYTTPDLLEFIQAFHTL